jgi:hypothetical protein
MKRFVCALAIVLFGLPAHAQREPDYSVWNRILRTHYDAARGMDYAALKARDAAALEGLRRQLGSVDPEALTPKQRLAYWINVYNVNVVATIVESYPVASIRDLSTDPIVRLNVFRKERVPAAGRLLSLDEVENVRLREAFHDPRVHFAINCAAKSCPPLRREAYIGERVDAQLDEQTRRFLERTRLARRGEALVVHVSKILDWFADDFETWGGGRIAFLRKYLPPRSAALLARPGRVVLAFDDYDWSLNDRR